MEKNYKYNLNVWFLGLLIYIYYNINSLTRRIQTNFSTTNRLKNKLLKWRKINITINNQKIVLNQCSTLHQNLWIIYENIILLV